jgi:diaminopimelate epimerase
MRDKETKLLEKTFDIQTSYWKGEGCGNTFIIFDCLDSPYGVDEKFIREAYPILLRENCDDALILKKESQDEEQLVLTMIVLEPDQTIAEFCGNGARVVGCYLRHKFGNQMRNYYLKTSGGLKKIWWDNGLFYVDMGKTKLYFRRNKFFNPNFETFNLGLGMKQFTFFWTETLEPHLVTFDEMTEEELFNLGLYINQHQRHFFPLGVNLNKAEVLSKTSLGVTTFERGVNRITAACGTGATSCAMLARALSLIKEDQDIDIFLKAGKIRIHPTKDASIMSGPAHIEQPRGN